MLIDQGQKIPLGYGFTTYRFDLKKNQVNLMPINFIIRAYYRLLFRSFPDKFDRMIVRRYRKAGCNKLMGVRVTKGTKCIRCGEHINWCLCDGYWDLTINDRI